MPIRANIEDFIPAVQAHVAAGHSVPAIGRLSALRAGKKGKKGKGGKPAAPAVEVIVEERPKAVRKSRSSGGGRHYMPTKDALMRLGSTPDGRNWILHRINPAVRSDGPTAACMPDDVSQQRVASLLVTEGLITAQPFPSKPSKLLYQSEKGTVNYVPSAAGVSYVTLASNTNVVPDTWNVIMVSTSSPQKPWIVIQHWGIPDMGPVAMDEMWSILLTQALRYPWASGAVLCPYKGTAPIAGTSGSPFFAGYLSQLELGDANDPSELTKRLAEMRVTSKSITVDVDVATLKNQGMVWCAQSPTQHKIITESALTTEEVLVLANPVEVSVLSAVDLEEGPEDRDDTNSVVSSVSGVHYSMIDSVKVVPDNVSVVGSVDLDWENIDVERSIGLAVTRGPGASSSSTVDVLTGPRSRQVLTRDGGGGDVSTYILANPDTVQFTKVSSSKPDRFAASVTNPEYNYVTEARPSFRNSGFDAVTVATGTAKVPTGSADFVTDVRFTSNPAKVMTNAQLLVDKVPALAGVTIEPTMRSALVDLEVEHSHLGLRSTYVPLFTGIPKLIRVPAPRDDDLVTKQVNCITRPPMTLNEIRMSDKTLMYRQHAKAGVYAVTRYCEPTQPFIPTTDARPTVYVGATAANEDAAPDLLSTAQALSGAASMAIDPSGMTTVIHFTNLDIVASLPWVGRQTIEGTVGVGSAWSNSVTDAPTPDPAAIANAAQLGAKLPHGYPASYNDMGLLMGKLIPLILELLAPTVLSQASSTVPGPEVQQQLGQEPAKHPGIIGSILGSVGGLLGGIVKPLFGGMFKNRGARSAMMSERRYDY